MGLNAGAEGTVISPDRKKPKKQVAAAAQSITVSGLEADAFHTALICRKRGGVMGRRGLSGGTPRSAHSRLTPACSKCKRGRVEFWRGSG